MKASYALNEEHQGIEVKFTDKPSEDIRASLKRFKFRWSRRQKLWYAKQTVKSMPPHWHDERLAFLASITSTPVETNIIACAADFAPKPEPAPDKASAILAILNHRAS
jgi:hypothetical protein